jgi:hypothetical protein
MEIRRPRPRRAVPPRPRRCQRAGSETISALILTSILAGSGGTYFASIIQFSQNEDLAVAGRLQLDREQAAERFNVTSVLVDGRIGARVFNFGAQPIQVAYVMVTRDADGQVVGVNHTALLSTPITANPGTASLDVVTEFEYPELDTYTVRVITRRGNVGNDIYPPLGPPVFLTLPNIGWLVMEFAQLQWAQSSSGNNGTWGAWSPGWEVPGNRYTVFRVNVTNRRDVAISMTPESLFMLFEGGSTDTLGFWVMNATLQNSLNAFRETDPTKPLQNVTAFTGSVGIPAGSWIWLYFSTASLGNGNPARFPPTDTSYATALMLYGTWGDGTPYAQTIPFVAVRRQ